MPLPNRFKFLMSSRFLEWADQRIVDDPYGRVAVATTFASAIDLCSGTGYGARVLATSHPGSTVLGVDLSPELVRHGNSLIKKQGLENVRLEVGDALHVEVPSGSQDLVSIFFGLHELRIPDQAGVLAEAHRIIRPGGRLVIVDLDLPARWSRLFSAYAYLSSGRRPWGVFREGLVNNLKSNGFLIEQHDRQLGRLLPFQFALATKQ